MITAIVIICLLPIALDAVLAYREWKDRRPPWHRKPVLEVATIEETF